MSNTWRSTLIIYKDLFIIVNKMNHFDHGGLQPDSRKACETCCQRTKRPEQHRDAR
jgi:hypothetical protein